MHARRVGYSSVQGSRISLGRTVEKRTRHAPAHARDALGSAADHAGVADGLVDEEVGAAGWSGAQACLTAAAPAAQHSSSEAASVAGSLREAAPRWQEQNAAEKDHSGARLCGIQQSHLSTSAGLRGSDFKAIAATARESRSNPPARKYLALTARAAAEHHGMAETKAPAFMANRRNSAQLAYDERPQRHPIHEGIERRRSPHSSNLRRL